MSQEDRPSKRPRTAANDAQEPLKHHDEFWLDDGNLILIARRAVVAFRVYRGLLVAQSTIFTDMISSSTPNPDEMIDGCPVVDVSDSPEDLAHLLRVLLPAARRRFYQEDAWTHYSFVEVFAVVRLAHTYNIADVQKQALYALREYTFNDSFEEWEGDREERIKVEGPCAIDAVNLTRLLEQPEMLVIALYKCLGPGSGMLDGWRREDGSVGCLSEDDVKRCITANRELSRSSVIAAYKTFRPEPSDKCNQESRCEASMRQTLVQYLDLLCNISQTDLKS